MSQLKILSLNVRGLRNREKRRSMFSYLKNQKAGIYFLQETFSRSLDEKIWSAELDGRADFLFTWLRTLVRRACSYKTKQSVLCRKSGSRPERKIYNITTQNRRELPKCCKS